MKSCVSTYSFQRLYAEGNFTRFDAIDKTKEFGCDGVEFVLSDTTPDGSTPREHALALAQHAREAGLEAVIYTTDANFLCEDQEKEVERLCRHIDIASECGIPLLRHDVAWGFGPDYQGMKTYQKVIEKVAPVISRVADYAKTKGVHTCSENHGLLMQDSNRMLELFDAVNNANYGFLCDMANFSGADENCAVAVSRLLNQIIHVHAKDVLLRPGMQFNPGRGYGRTRGGNYRRSTIFGHGDVPTFQILAAIKNSGYDGYVSLEFEGMEPVLEAIEIGAENIQRMIKQLEQEG